MTRTALSDLDLRIAVIAAPMAGGPSTPALVIAAARAGGLGFVPGGYRTPDALVEQIRGVRAATATFGVNLFAPNPVPVEPARYAAYREAIRVDAQRFGAAVAEEPVEDDDRWRDKIDLLLADPVPVVSFTFGIPDGATLAALRRAGSVLVQTVTTVDEARRAVDAGMDALAVQASAAGGHSGTLTPQHGPAVTSLPQLLVEIGTAVDLPMIAAGGLTTAHDVAAAIRCGAEVVMVGTALLLAPEAGTSDVHRTALVDAGRGDTVVTRAFTGRPARALRNTFVDVYNSQAPAGYPALHHLTSPMRKAAAAAGDPEYVNLWAGTGYRSAIARPAADTLAALAADL